MDRYRNLLRRVAYLESLLFEGKQDQENLLNFLGQDYYDKYNLIKDKIQDPEYKDIYRMMKKDPSEVEDYIDDFQSNMELRREAKKGAKEIYNQNGGKVYGRTTYEAAVYYGSNTRWCISGRYDDSNEEEGRFYFNDYIIRYDLDNGYYFYIKNNNEKYCLLRKENGETQSIWDAEDNELEPITVITENPDFPDIPEVFDLHKCISDHLFSNDIGSVRLALDAGADIDDYYPEYDNYPLIYHVEKRNYEIVNFLLDEWANPDVDNGKLLAIAIEQQDDDLLNLLINSDANVNEDIVGNITATPLQLAVYNKNYDAIEILVDNGAYVDQLYDEDFNRNFVDEDSVTAMLDRIGISR